MTSSLSKNSAVLIAVATLTLPTAAHANPKRTQSGEYPPPIACELSEDQQKDLANADEFTFDDLPQPPPPMPGETPPPPPPPPAKAGVDDQDTDGTEENGTSASDRTLCPNPAIFNTQLIIHHIYIGQGDSTFIRTPGGMLTILIDGGESGHQKEILSVLSRCYKLNNVDYVVLSHPHSDHFGGLLELLKLTAEGIQVTKSKAQPTFQVNRGVYMTGFAPTPIKGGNTKDKAIGAKLQQFMDIAQTIDSARMKVRAIPSQSTMFIPYGKQTFISRNPRETVKFNVVVANGETTNGKKPQCDDQKKNPDRNCLLNGQGDLLDPNSSSSGIHINFGTFDYFTSGDLSGGGKSGIPAVEGALISSGLVKKMDVVKANHHGSDTSNSLDLIKLFDPTIYVISAGDAGQNMNSFHLPRLQPVLDMAAQTAKHNGLVISTSCGAGNIMPNHPFCQMLLPLDEVAEREKSTKGKTGFNYEVGLVRDPKDASADPRMIQAKGGLASNLQNFLNAQGDIVLTTDGSQYFLLVPHNPTPKVAPRILKVSDGSMPAITMAPEAPVALGPFKTDGIDGSK